MLALPCARVHVELRIADFLVKGVYAIRFVRQFLYDGCWLRTDSVWQAYCLACGLYRVDSETQTRREIPVALSLAARWRLFTLSQHGIPMTLSARLETQRQESQLIEPGQRREQGAA